MTIRILNKNTEQNPAFQPCEGLCAASESKNLRDTLLSHRHDDAVGIADGKRRDDTRIDDEL